jgi:hypothetical protein
MEEKIEELIEESGVPEKKRVSHEELWGKLLGILSVIFFVSLIGVLVWFGYRNLWKGKDVRISIEAIPKSEAPVVIEQKEIASAAKEATSTVDKKVAIMVLNGGAAKGSAAAAQTVVQGEGFPNVTTGNAEKDHEGVAVYYGADTDKISAEAVVSALGKKYKNVSIAKGTADADTKKSAIVVIVGK